MVFSLVVPQLGNPKNTKDFVITILTSDWPLTLKQIYNKIKNYGYSSSYQAVYKAVKELVSSNAILEKEKKYEMNIGWIKKLQSFTDIVETNYYAKSKIRDISGLKESKHNENITILNFETIFDAEKYLYYLMKYELMKTNNDSVCYSLSNEWRPLYYFRAEYNYYKKLSKKGHKFYFICSSNSKIEKQCQEFYTSIGIKYKFTNETSINETLVFKDYFITMFIPEEIKRIIKENLKKNNLIVLLEKALNKKSDIRLVINKDKAISDQIKKQIISKF